MTEEAKVTYHHEPVMDVVVLRRNAQGKPIVVEHRCRLCGRLISDWKHYGGAA